MRPDGRLVPPIPASGFSGEELRSGVLCCTSCLFYWRGERQKREVPPVWCGGEKFNRVLIDILKRETPKIVGNLTSLILSSLVQLVLYRVVFMLWQKPIITSTHPTEEESNRARSWEIIQFWLLQSLWMAFFQVGLWSACYMPSLGGTELPTEHFQVLKAKIICFPVGFISLVITSKQFRKFLEKFSVL